MLLASSLYHRFIVQFSRCNFLKNTSFYTVLSTSFVLIVLFGQVLVDNAFSLMSQCTYVHKTEEKCVRCLKLFKLVEMRRIELLTPCLQGRCSPSWATPPNFYWYCVKTASAYSCIAFVVFPCLNKNYSIQTLYQSQVNLLDKGFSSLIYVNFSQIIRLQKSPCTSVHKFSKTDKIRKIWWA